MTTIRPNPFPPTPPQAGPSADAAKLAAQKAFFAMVSGPAQPPAATSVAPSAAPPTPAPAVRNAASAADPPQKIARPGSLFDIRV